MNCIFKKDDICVKTRRQKLCVESKRCPDYEDDLNDIMLPEKSEEKA